MRDVLLEKINNIENMIKELHTKIDNFLGYEDLSDEEKREVEKIRNEVREGKYAKFEEVFGEH